MPVLRGRLACPHHPLRQSPRHRGRHLADGHRLAGGGGGPFQGHSVHPVPGHRARRTAPATVHDDAPGLAGTGAHLQGPAGKAHREGSLHLRLPGLSAAAIGRHPHLPGQPGARGRGPGAPHRVLPGDRPPLQPPLRQGAGLRGEGGSRGEEAGWQEGQALPGTAHPLPAGGGRGRPGIGQGPAGRDPESVPGRQGAALRLPGRRRQDDPHRARSPAHRGLQDARPGRPEDVQVLRQHHFPAGRPGRGEQEDPHHAHRPGPGAPHRSGQPGQVPGLAAPRGLFR